MGLVRTSVSAMLLLNIPGATFASGASADSKSAVAPSAAEGQPAERKERLICRREADSTSRLRAARICKTAEQWRQR